MSKETELAWAAGFFDGEGSTFLNRHKVTHFDRPGRPFNYVSSPTISVCQVDRRPLDRFVAAIGAGRVRGPFKPKTKNSNEYYRVEFAGRDRVSKVLWLLWEYLSPVKREQALEVWEKEKTFRTNKSPPMPKLPENYDT